MSNKIKVLIGIAVAVLIPLSLFVLAKKMSKDKTLLPGYYNIENIIGEGDTVYSKVTDVTLTNQLGDTVSIIAGQPGKAIILSLLDYSKGSHWIDSAERNIRVMQKSFLKKIPERFHFVSIIMNNDSVNARILSDRVKADHDRWWFVTGDSSSVATYARKVSPQRQDIAASYKDSAYMPLILIDSARYFRGYYNALDPISLKKCADDAILIFLEKKKRK